MSTLNFISLPINLRSFRYWSATRNVSDDEGAALHHLLGESFGKSVLQPFRMMVAPGSKTATLYAYTKDSLDNLVQTSALIGTPDALAVCDPNKMAIKAMPQTLPTGKRLAFDVRVRPVRRMSNTSETFKKGAEVDVFLNDVVRLHPEGPDLDNKIDRETLYRNWLSDRFGEAAEIIQARMVRFERSIALRNGRKCEGPDVTFHGELIIRDQDKFFNCLEKGIGRHTAYGYGMLLLRPPSR